MRRDSPQRSIGREAGRVLRAVVVTALLLLAANVGPRVYILARLEPQARSYEIAGSDLAALHAAMIDEETGLRGFLASGDRTFLQPYRTAQPKLRRLPAQLAARLDDEQDQTDLVRMVQTIHAWNRDWVATVLVPGDLRGLGLHGTQDPTERAQLTGFLLRGKQLFDAYRAAEARLADALDAHVAATSDAETRWVLGSGAFQALVALAVIGVAIAARRKVAQRVTGPVADIARAVRRVRSGEADALQPLESGPEELVTLSTDVAAMAAELREQVVATEQGRARADAHARRLAVVLDAAREVSGSLNPRYVMASVVNGAVKLGYASARIWLLDDSQETLRLAFDSGVDVSTQPQRRVDARTGVLGQAVQRGFGVRRQAFSPSLAGEVVAVPMIIGARPIGVLECVATAADAREPEVLEVLEALVLHAAGAVAAAELHVETANHAVTDVLTGLPNRRAFETEFPSEVARALRYARPLSLISIDLDHFKSFNDTFGHSYGDAVLQQAAHALRDAVRETDRLYRLGGEELAVVCPETGIAEALTVAERLRAAVEASGGPEGAQVTASLGVAEIPGNAVGGDELCEAADRAMYDAKQAGRNRVTGAGAAFVSAIR